MKKIFVAPQLQVIALSEEDVLTLSTAAIGDSMVLELGELFSIDDSND